jgi:hypothetical protein
MNSNTNNDKNNFKSATLSDSYSCSFDKNEFCVENGMPFNTKKDSKSHGKKALDKAEAHKKKTDLRQKATEEDPVMTTPGKIKKINVSNVLHNRKLSDPGNETQETLLKYYEEQILGENDGCEEAFAAKDALEAEELAVKQALEAETEQCRLMFISENCSLETTKYHQGLSLWQRYGLSEAQYIANQIYLADCALLDAYNYSYDDVTGLNPAQVQKLKARILAFEQQQILEEQAEAEAEDANDWWIDERFKQKDMVPDSEVDVEELEEELEEDMEQVDLDEWLENKREEDFESWKQEMIDRDA